jgi:sporulation protein YlmC with PRC-barrel domain
MSSAPSNSNYFKREDLLGKSVVSRNAEIIGTVADLAVSLDGRATIQVQRKATTDTSELYIGSDEIQAVGDVVLLKTTSDMAGKGAPSQAVLAPSSGMASTASSVSSTSYLSSSQGKSCPKCGFLNSPNAKFCIKCGTSLSP